METVNRLWMMASCWAEMQIAISPSWNCSHYCYGLGFQLSSPINEMTLINWCGNIGAAKGKWTTREMGSTLRLINAIRNQTEQKWVALQITDCNLFQVCKREFQFWLALNLKWKSLPHILLSKCCAYFFVSSAKPWYRIDRLLVARTRYLLPLSPRLARFQE